MTFENQKKTFLEKLDRSKKGSIDQKAKKIIQAINECTDYYTTSSCSGRVYFWKGNGKKNETKWIRVSHDIVNKDFFYLDGISGMVWFRLEGFIIHIACRDIKAANTLLSMAKEIYKKSCILSASNKIIVEIRGGEFLEMPFYKDSNLLFSGDINWLTQFVNDKFETIWKNTKKLEREIKK